MPYTALLSLCLSLSLSLFSPRSCSTSTTLAPADGDPGESSISAGRAGSPLSIRHDDFTLVDRPAGIIGVAEDDRRILTRGEDGTLPEIPGRYVTFASARSTISIAPPVFRRFGQEARARPDCSRGRG